MSYVADGFNGEVLDILQLALHLLDFGEPVAAFVQLGGQSLLLLLQKKHDNAAGVVL